MDEVFVCGPEAMMEATESALRAAGVPESRIHIERFLSTASPSQASPLAPTADALPLATGPHTTLTLIVDGKTHELQLPAQTPILEAALQAGLDIPYSCKGGVCCTCKAKLLQGQVQMVRNFTLQANEVAQGFVLTCQALALTPELVVSYDER
jgi:ring-1,2-phenylacetyl-CoA epoxidase subunit PaaE